MDWGYGGVRSKCDCGRRKITREIEMKRQIEKKKRERGRKVRA